MPIIQLIYVYFQRTLIKMQEGDVKAVYIVEPISRNHKNHTNHLPSLKTFLWTAAYGHLASTYSYIILKDILRQFYEV